MELGLRFKESEKSLPGSRDVTPPTLLALGPDERIAELHSTVSAEGGEPRGKSQQRRGSPPAPLALSHLERQRRRRQESGGPGQRTQKTTNRKSPPALVTGQEEGGQDQGQGQGLGVDGREEQGKGESQQDPYGVGSGALVPLREAKQIKEGQRQQ